MKSQPPKCTFHTWKSQTFNTFLGLKPTFFVLTVINFQNLECTTWWLTVHKFTQNSTCSRQNDSFNNFKLLKLFPWHDAFTSKIRELWLKKSGFYQKRPVFRVFKKFTLFLTSIEYRSGNLLNRICHIIYCLPQAKEITKKVYNNMNSITI